MLTVILGSMFKGLEAGELAIKAAFTGIMEFMWGNTEKWEWQHKDQSVGGLICQSVSKTP